MSGLDTRGATGRRFGASRLILIAIILGALAFIGFSMLTDLTAHRVDIATGSRFSCTVLSVYDGDGPINCAEIDQNGKPVRVRLRGIEAREADNSCQLGDQCPKASGAEAKGELTRMAFGKLSCESFGPSYNRVDATCTNPDGLNLSCEMIRRGMAVRWPQYDPDGLMLPCVPKR